MGNITTTTLLTPAQKHREARNAAILARWKQLTANPASSKEEIGKQICREFGCSQATIYQLRKKHNLV